MTDLELAEICQQSHMSVTGCASGEMGLGLLEQLDEVLGSLLYYPLHS